MKPSFATQDTGIAGPDSSEFLEMAFATLSDAIFVISPATSAIVACNKGAEKIFGYSREEIIGRNTEFLHADRAHYEDFGKELLPILDAKPALKKEFMMRRRDGSVFPAEHTVTEIRDNAGNRVSVVSAVRDITELKRAERALADSEQKYSQLVGGAREGVWVVDKDGLTSFVNPSMAKMLGYSTGEMLGRRFFSFMDEVGDATSRQNMERLKQGISDRRDVEFLHKDGSRVCAAMETSPILDESGNFAGALADVINIAGRKFIEAQLKEAEENDRHLSKMEAIGSLAAGIAHEFNNTLHAVMGYAALAKDRARDDEKLVHYMDYILKACDRGRDIISRLLVFSMKSPYSPSVTDAARLVQGSIDMLRTIVPPAIEITSNVDMDAGSIMTDKTMFAQLMANLASNAAHAMKNGRGRIVVTLAPVSVDEDYIKSMRARVKIGKLAAGKYALLSFADTGCGIPADIMDKIFDPFISYKPVGEGAGLGLAVVGGLVLRVDGAIAMESELGVGSTFHLYFPVTQESTAQEQVSSVAPKDASSNRQAKRVLLVDDDALVLALTEETLSAHRFSVVTAVNGEEALDIFNRDPSRFDVAIIDQVMPKMTGDVLARKVKEKRPDMPIILCTGHSKLTENGQDVEPQIANILRKPFGPKELLETIGKHFPM